MYHFALLLSGLLPVLASAQQEHQLSGYLGVEGGELFTFKLTFTVSGNTISGHSYTWLNEGSEVKASVSGTLDRATRSLTFKEDKILYNQGFKSNVTICLIESRLRYKKEGGSVMFTGPITSSDVTNVSCGRGTITFPDSEELRKLFSESQETAPAPVVKPTASKAPPKKPIRIVYDTGTVAKPVQTPAVNVVDKITEGKDKTYKWQTDSLVLEVWDGGKIDGDVVTIVFNGKVILAGHAITAEKKRLVVPLPETSTVYDIRIRAVSEGNEPPNTANILLWDGLQSHPVIAYNKIGKEAVIKIVR